MNLWVVRVIVSSIIITALQVAVLSNLRLGGVVIMAIWLWTLVVGLLGGTPPAMVAGATTGALFDAHVSTPFGLFIAIGLLGGYVAGQLGREGIGDFKAAAWWMPSAIGLAVGFVTPLVLTAAAALTGNLQFWRGDLGATMVVNALVFAVAIRGTAIVAHRLMGDVEGYRW
ncbi:unannotated protein [freshwater metagenome]|uniref:Unannotated protein n=1 Tax=freshwater metagenome TaxID=449393 RepID=A0A6J7DKN1_9ZZZZ